MEGTLQGHISSIKRGKKRLYHLCCIGTYAMKTKIADSALSMSISKTKTIMIFQKKRSFKRRP